MRKTIYFKKWQPLLLGILLVCLSGSTFACFTIIAGKKATSSHTIMFGRNSDSKDARRSKNYKIYLDAIGNQLYTGLPYSDLEFDPSHDMAQVASNRFGVALSATQTIQNNIHVLTLDPMTSNGISEPNIPMLVMPNAKSAKEGIVLLGAAIAARGVSDSKGFGVIIGDQHEAWYLETLSGHQWVAVRIPDSMYFVAANGPGQIQEYVPEKYTYLLSNHDGVDPITFAKEHGIAHFDEGVFNFRTTYGNIQPKIDDFGNTIRVSFAQHLLTPSTQLFNEETIYRAAVPPMFLSPDSPITVDMMKAIQSSHYEAFPEIDPYRYEISQPRFRPIANYRASNAHITEVGSAGSDFSIANLEYISLGMPGISMYFPIYYGLSEIPHQLQGATNEADDDSLFWQFRKLQVLAFLSDQSLGIPYEFSERQAYIQDHYKALNQLINQEQQRLMKQYLQHNNPQLINDFTKKVVDAISLVNKEMIDHFIKQLDIDLRYGLTTTNQRNTWFTRMAREQECRFRSASETQC